MKFKFIKSSILKKMTNFLFLITSSLFAYLILSVNSSEFEQENNIIILTDKNFDSAVKSFKHLVVNFCNKSQFIL